MTSEPLALVIAGWSSTFAMALGRGDVMVGLWCLWLLIGIVSVIRKCMARQDCENVLEAITCQAERVAEDGGRVSWFEHEVAKFDPVKAERVRRRRKRS